MATLLLLLTFTNITVISSLCSSNDYVNKIRNILSQQSNYDVYEGKLIFRQNASFVDGTNPSGIYGTPYYENIENITNPNSVSPHSTYYFRSSNALIFPGCTPPKSKYFSFISYIMDRFNDYDNKTYKNTQKMLYASLGAALNNLVWNTTSSEMINNYDSLTTVIQTGDNNTYADIYNILTNNNISSSEINLQSLPNEYINWLPYEYNTHNIAQYNSTYDTGTFLLRLTITENKNEYQQYINTNQSIFILQPKNINNKIQPFDPLRRDTYSVSNFNETSSVYEDVLNEYKSDLITYLQTTYNLSYKTCEIFVNMMSEFGKSDYGFDCIDENINCGGDDRDSQYWQASNNITLMNNEYYIVLGIMHSNYDIQQTLYSNIVYDNSVLNRDRKHNPSITCFEYNGSGLILPVKTNINKNYLQNIFVVQITTPDLCIDGLPGFCIDNNQDIGRMYDTVVVRNYLNPITKTRPDLSEIMPCILLEFKK